MTKWLEKFQMLAMAVAFAEAGEWNTAQQIMEQDRQKKRAAERPNSRPGTDKRPRLRA